MRLAASIADQLDARIRELEAQVASLQSENATLKEDLTRLRELYQTATSESSVTNISTFDNRRAILLRSQNVQLQREVMAQRNAILQKEHVAVDVEVEVGKVRELVKGILNEDTTKYSPRHIDSLKQTLQITSTVNKMLHKHPRDNIMSSEEERTAAVELLSEFVCPKRRKETVPVSVADVCSGRVEHLNLRHVGRLEGLLRGLEVVEGVLQ
ncbi:hypothetical protein HK097_009510 [Rhizophlyctis rosea]|uniref:Uncharacterized protein n=1 Tax=Rhizophlyctis rosea TaxID=64517 RepID=A0AAD5SH03_9FUNG|nr:hypothetical protein HK097_009510 [Rhizophlyctis rosea]